VLHRMNPVRVKYILDKLREVEQDEESEQLAHNRGRALSGLDVLDVGCGGGLMSEVRIQQQFLLCTQLTLNPRVSLDSELVQLV
jgi:2-polyprenyl-3-methyl-5-hydroxy-6-metoxy-1,4-benzoquinol methylase